MKNKKKNKSVIQNQIFQLITVFVFFSFILVFGILFFVSPKESYSEIERRPLKQFPEFDCDSFVSGEYTEDISTYVSDNFVYREKLVDMSKKLEEKRGMEYDGLTLYSDSGDNTSQNIKTGVDKPLQKINKANNITNIFKLGEEKKVQIEMDNILENKEIYEKLEEKEVVGQKVGALFVLEDRALEIFSGNSSAIKDYVNVLNTYKLSLVNPDTNVYCLVLPTHYEFGLPSKQKKDVNIQKPYIEEIYSSLNPAIKTVDAYSNIRKHYANDEYLYFRTDHHWTALGAYRAYESFAQTAGFEATPLSDFEQRKIEKFLGTFSSKTGNSKLKNNPDYIEYYAPKNECNVTNYVYNSEGNLITQKGFVVANKVNGVSNGYLAFLGGDKPMTLIETDAGTGRSIIVFKESYGNAFVPFLTSNFDKIYVADIRSFPYNAVNFVINNEEITDVLFLNSIMTSCSYPRIKNYIDLLEK